MPEWDETGKLIEDAPAARKSPADIFRDQLATAGSFGHTPQPEEMPQGALGKLGLAGTIASLPMGVQAAGAPLAALKSLGLGVAGASAGGYAGRGLGQGLEHMGAPEGTSEVAGTVGGLVGGLAGPIKGPAGLLKLAELSGGKSGMLAALARRALPEAAEGAAGAATTAVDTNAIKAAKVAASEARAAEAHAARMETAKLRNEILRKKLAGETVPKVPKAKPAPPAAPPTEGATALQPEPDFIDPSAVKVLPFPPAKGTVKPATNLGGAAKPGPAPTPPDKLEETLQATLDSLKAKKGAVRGKSPVVDQALDTAEGMHQREATAGMTEAVADKRRRLGSQVVAREMGMGRHEVQSDAGTILNEALGEVSPVIPADRWKDIVTKMKSLPPEERTAYVARARGVKNMAQIENLRRTLETLGLLLPLGAVAGSVDQ